MSCNFMVARECVLLSSLPRGGAYRKANLPFLGSLQQKSRCSKTFNYLAKHWYPGHSERGITSPVAVCSWETMYPGWWKQGLCTLHTLYIQTQPSTDSHHLCAMLGLGVHSMTTSCRVVIHFSLLRTKRVPVRRDSVLRVGRSVYTGLSCPAQVQ